MGYSVRYYSRSGNTRAIAETIARAAGVKAVSVDEADASIKKNTDVLFIGGALYAYGLDSHLKAYLNSIDGKLIKKAVVFSSTWISKHSINLIKNALKEKGVEVVDEAFYVREKPSAEQLKQAEGFAARYL